MKENACCFTGHRILPQKDFDTIKNRLESEVENLINQGVLCFFAGGALGFDTLAAMSVLKLRLKYPTIKLILILPCEGQTKGWKQIDIDKYNWIKSHADKVHVLSPHYYNGCMLARNRYLVDNSEYCICYILKSTGGTAYTVAYANKKGLKIIKI